MPQFSQSVADLFATLGIDTSKFQQGLAYAKTETQKAADDMRGHFEKIEKLTTKLGGTLGPEKLAAALKEATKQGIGLEKTLLDIEAGVNRVARAREADANARAKEVVSRDVLGASGEARLAEEALKLQQKLQAESLQYTRDFYKQRNAAIASENAAVAKDYSNLVSNLRAQEVAANAASNQQLADSLKYTQSFYRERNATITAQNAAVAKDYSNLVGSLRAQESAAAAASSKAATERSKQLAAVEKSSDAIRARFAAQQEADMFAASRMIQGEIDLHNRKAKEIAAANARILADTRRTQRDLIGIGQGLMVAGTMMGAGITAPLVAMGSAALKASAFIETNTVAFTRMTGSVAAAQEHLEKLRKFSLTTPFQFEEVVAADKKLRAIGFTAQEVVPMLTAVGDAAAMMGGGAERIELITKAFADIRGHGKLMAQELKQLGDSGIAAREILAKGFGITIPEVMERTRKGLISADDAIRILVKGIQERSGGMMNMLMDTLEGRISTLKDKLTFALQDVGEPLNRAAKNAIGVAERALEFAQMAAKIFGVLPQPIQDTAIALGLVAAALSPITIFAGSLAFSIGQLIPLFGKLSGAVGFLSSLLPLIPWAGAIAGAYGVYEAVTKAAQGIVNFNFDIRKKTGVSEANIFKDVEQLEENLKAAGIGFKHLSDQMDKGMMDVYSYYSELIKLQKATAPPPKAKPLTTEEYNIAVNKLKVQEILAKSALQIQEASEDARLKAGEVSAEEWYRHTLKKNKALMDLEIDFANRRIALEKQKGEELKDTKEQVAIAGFKAARNEADNRARIEFNQAITKRKDDRLKLEADMAEAVLNMEDKLADRRFKRQTELWAEELKLVLKNYKDTEEAREKAEADQEKADLAREAGVLAHTNNIFKMWRVHYDLLEAQGKINARQKMDLLDQLDAREEQFQEDSINRSIDLLNKAGGNNKEAIQILQDKLQALGDTRMLRQLNTELRKVNKEMSELQRVVDRAFNNMARGIAKNIVEWKGWGATLTEIFKDFKIALVEVLVQEAMKPLKKAMTDLVREIEDSLLKPLIKKIKDTLISIFGGTKSGGGPMGPVGGGIPLPPTVPGVPIPGVPMPPLPPTTPVPGRPPGPGGGGTGGAVTGMAGGAIGGWVSLISGAVTAVSSVIGNFQMAGMNKSLDLIVNHTLRIFNETANFRADAWAREAHLMVKLDDIWNSIREVKGGGGPTTIYVQGITNLDQFVRELKARGFVIAPV